MRVRDLADFLGATFEGDGEKEIDGVADVESAGASQLSFAGSRKSDTPGHRSAAGCLIVPPEFDNREGRTVIRFRDPRLAFARSVRRLRPPEQPPAGIHPTAVIAGTAVIGGNVSVGPHSTVGAESRVGDGCRIAANCSIGSRVGLGAGSILHANVTLYDDIEVGERAILHSGCVIGADGFGFVFADDHYEKFPQIGRVVIGDDVEIGANACVDRAALGVTWIGDGTKLDNMVHVGHNCRIGRHVVVAAQTGFSGGVVVEDFAVIGGQVGIGDKARIESRAVLGSGCGVLTSKIIRAGQVVWGTPARPLREYLEMLANLGRLPELRKEIADIKQRLNSRKER